MTRTEHDTWDLATSVGATATMVAAGRARASRAGLMQPMTDLLAARTRYFDAFFADAAAAGIRRGVILAYLTGRGWHTSRTRLSDRVADNYCCTATLVGRPRG
jgi:O-methyltransferase involved in polyketide biosynthesis